MTTPSSTSKKKRGESWTEDGMRAAIKAVQRCQLTQRAASTSYNIPRRTLRDHLKIGSVTKRLGRKPIFTDTQESDLVARIKRFAKIGVPLTPKFIRKQAYLFCERYDIKNNFNEVKRIAGADWLRLFLKRNPSISKRKLQIMNPARAQKLNKSIVEQHFQAVKKLYDELDILRHPEILYNMDEKGCRITVHKQQTVLAEKGSKRVHLIAPEHAENVTITMCVNAIGTAIPPMILFKGQRQRPDLSENLPAGTLVRMAPKGSMTSDLFVEFIKHLSQFKVAGKCLLVFDGAKCHLSCEALDEAEKNDIVLYCLPSNTTHELQPLDKSVNKSFEHHWDEAAMNFLYANADKKMTKSTFNKIFSQVWPKCMTHSNIVNGFKATGLFPFNPEAIPEEAYAPSILSEIPCSAIQQQPMQDSDLDADTGNSTFPSDIPCLPACEQLMQDIGSEEDTAKPSMLSKTLPPPTHKQFMSNTRLLDYAGNFQDISIQSEVTFKDSTRTKSRLVEYSSSTEFSEGEEEEKREKEDTGPSASSPSILAATCSALEASCSRLLISNVQDNRGISPITSIASSVSEVDFHLNQNYSKLAVADVYTSSEEENESSFNKVYTTPKKQTIYNLSRDIHKTNSDGFTCSDDSEDNLPLSTLNKQNSKTPFQEFLPTPKYAVVKTKHPRKKAINYKGQRITKDLFAEDKNTKQRNIKKVKNKKEQENNAKHTKTLREKKTNR
ncbi:uncharacterized protein LOC113236244, partial [Hyposmocoma kahamanoa]|uniref:uncharacterized protein LOC113236244 n=1 Tax=Hyposmocoma kahamanoa TaxID=1477025 RepID=UPI000E6D5FE0